MGILANDPAYGYYSNTIDAHLIVITGAVSAPGHENLVTTNNPSGGSNIQTYAGFLAGFPHDTSGMTLGGILSANR